MTWIRPLPLALALAVLVAGCTATPVAPLSVIIDTPTPSAIDVDPATVIQIRFGIDIGSLPDNRFSLRDAGGVSVAGEMTYTPNTATFTPDAPLAEGTTYTATLRTPIRAGGRALADDVTWSFTTWTRFEAVTLTLTDLEHVYDQQPHAATVTAVPDVAVSVTYDGSPDAPSAAGTYDVVATVTAAGYAGEATGTLTIARRPLTLTGVSAADKVYDATTAVVVDGEAALTGVLAPDDVTLSGTPSFAFASPNAGAAVAVVATGVALSGVDAANYALTDLGLTAAITARPITITARAGQSKTYGEDDPVFAYDADGLVAGDTLTGALGRSAGEDVGTYGYTIGTLSGGANYAIAFPAGAERFAIEPRVLRIVPDAEQSKEFAADDPVLTFTAVGLIDGDAAGGALGRVPGEAIGFYDYVLGSVDAGDNYALALTGDARFEVRPRTLVVTPDTNQSKEIGTADPIFTFTHTALLPGDALTGALAREAGETVGEYAFTLGTLEAPEVYRLTLSESAPRFQIAAMVVTITPTAGLSKGFGDEDPELTFTATGLAEGEQVTGTLAREAGEDAGTYAYVLGSLDAGPNYALTFSPGVDAFTITPRTVTVTPGANQRKVFGNDDPASFAFETTGFLGDDDLVGGTLGRAAGENVGTYPFTVDGLDGGPNYDFALVDGAATFAITALPVVITPTPGQSKVEGAADPLPFTFTLSPAIPLDELEGAIGREPGEDVGTYRYLLGTFGGNPNYALSIAPDARFTILAAD